MKPYLGKEPGQLCKILAQIANLSCLEVRETYLERGANRGGVFKHPGHELVLS